jgi:checkpoint serine/threonine-protein kinase
LAVWRYVFQSLPEPMNPQMVIPIKEQLTVNPRTGKNERIFVNLEAVYPTPEQSGTELSFEELRAGSRGWLLKTWKSEKQSVPVLKLKTQDEQPVDPSDENSAALSRNRVERLVPGDPVILDENGVVKESGRPGRPRKLRTMEVNETQISKLIYLE